MSRSWITRHPWRITFTLLTAMSLSVSLRGQDPVGDLEPLPNARARPPSPERPPADNTGLTAPGLRMPGEFGIGPEPVPPEMRQPPGLLRYAIDPPNGFTGSSGVLPREPQSSSDAMPVEDRWRLGFPSWDRYDKGHPLLDDYPYQLGRLLDPYNQNVLKGDYPIFGQHTFLDLTARADMFFEPRQIPTQTTPFESTARSGQFDFFGRTQQFLTTNFFSLSADLFHGDAAFRPVDWRLKLMPVFNVNNFNFSERAQVSPNVLQGAARTRTWWAMQEMYFEGKLADLSNDYDFMSIRAGTQPFISDFRGFLFADQNLGVRLFGNRLSNRDQYNLAYFRQWEKDTNSFLNTFNQRNQDLVFLNYYRQDFLFPGYTTQLSLTYNHDPARFKFDKNRFLVRPDPVGVFQPHTLHVGYFGWGGDGHIGRYNITHQFYWAYGHDSMNPIAGQPVTINAQMAAIEGSYDRDWARFRVSFFWASGDQNAKNNHATGFDTILDQPNFAGGPFSFWNRQQIPLFGVNLVQRLSLVPDLRSSKVQGQSNFVNPGLVLPNVGFDLDLTPKLKMINNYNLLFFDKTSALQTFVYQGAIDRFIGADLSAGFEYRPLLSENVVMVFGVSTLIPGQGFQDLYNHSFSSVNPLVAGFMNLVLQY